MLSIPLSLIPGPRLIASSIKCVTCLDDETPAKDAAKVISDTTRILFQLFTYWNLSIVGLWTLVLQRVFKEAFYSFIDGSSPHAAEVLLLRAHPAGARGQPDLLPEQETLEPKVPGVYDSEPDILSDN